MNASTITPELQHILDEFAQQQAMQAYGGKNSPEYQNLVESIQQSPHLLERMNEAAQLGTFFQHIKVLDENTHAGGEYHADEKALYMKVGSLSFGKRELPSEFRLPRGENHAAVLY